MLAERVPEAVQLAADGFDVVLGGLATVLKPQTSLSLVAVDDIGRAAAAAIAEPDRFHGGVGNDRADLV